MAVLNAVAQSTRGIITAWADGEVVLAQASEALGRRVFATSLTWLKHAGLLELGTVYGTDEDRAAWRTGRVLVRLTQEGLVEQFAHSPEVVR